MFKKPKEEIVEDDMFDCQLCDERLPTIAALQAHTLAKHIPQVKRGAEGGSWPGGTWVFSLMKRRRIFKRRYIASKSVISWIRN